MLAPVILFVGSLPNAAATATYGRISVSGQDFSINGSVTDERFFGVVDTTALQFAILAYVDGQTQYAGKTSVFNGPDTSGLGMLEQNANPTAFWSQYFGLLRYFNCNLVRIGAGDGWGTGIQFDAWTNHHDAFLSLLDTMLDEAQAHQVWVVLVLAGTQEYPTYQYGGSGSVFDTTTYAYADYISYTRGVMSALEGQTALGWFDMFNEPDHNAVYSTYWSGNGGTSAFHAWACDIAAQTAGASTHPRSMGTAEVDNMFGMNKQAFDLATGAVPFEIADIHYYASNTDSNNFAMVQQWASEDGKPLFWSELGYNAVYPLTRYTFAEDAIYANGGQAITSMVLTGAPGYPYTGGTLPESTPVQAGPINGMATPPAPVPAEPTNGTATPPAPVVNGTTSPAPMGNSTTTPHDNSSSPDSTVLQEAGPGDNMPPINRVQDQLLQSVIEAVLKALSWVLGAVPAA